MGQIIKNIMNKLFRFFYVKRNLYLSLLILIALMVLVEGLVLGLTRRTFVFYTALEGNIIVEDRMFRRSDSKETDIRRYIEEVLLGPVSPDAVPLLSLETRLLSLIFRDGVVYADFSEVSALPVELPRNQTVFSGFLTLYEGIRRNFSSVKDVKFFIGGNQIFYNEFNVIFANFADNTI